MLGGVEVAVDVGFVVVGGVLVGVEVVCVVLEVEFDGVGGVDVGLFGDIGGVLVGVA